MVEVLLFGGVRVARDGAPAAPVDGRPARALLCWLALHRGPQPRALVAARLWPGVLDESARVSLRAALSALRRSLGRRRRASPTASRWPWPTGSRSTSAASTPCSPRGGGSRR